MSFNCAPLQLSFAHTPDADDAFMLHALSQEKVTSSWLKFKHIIKPIQELNGDAGQAMHDVSALSLGAYPYVEEHYRLLPAGACMGFNYGPLVLSAKPMAITELKRAAIAIPGKLTTAYLVLQLFNPELSVIEMQFDRIPQAILSGQVDAGLVIHEAQLTHEKLGLTKLLDLGQWWHGETGLPLPLGGNVIRRSLSKGAFNEVIRLYKESITYALSHKEEALASARQYARGMSPSELEKFVCMYVNDASADYGKLGMTAVNKLFELAYKKGLLKQKLEPALIGV